jgi:hypothetical protein
MTQGPGPLDLPRGFWSNASQRGNRSHTPAWSVLLGRESSPARTRVGAPPACDHVRPTGLRKLVQSSPHVHGADCARRFHPASAALLGQDHTHSPARDASPAHFAWAPLTRALPPAGHAVRLPVHLHDSPMPAHRYLCACSAMTGEHPRACARLMMI